MNDRAQRRVPGARGRRRMSMFGMLVLSGLVLAVVVVLVVLGLG